MSDDFIPLNQSTPVQGRWQQRGHSQQNSYQNNWQQKNNRRRQGRNHRSWSNNSHHSNSFGSDSNNSYNRDQGIDAYLHPSMLQDPWAHLREANQQT